MDFTLEELSMAAWPSLATILYDGWVIRLSDGYGNRGNSVNPIYPSKIDLEEKIIYCDDFFARHNLPATYKLAECEEQARLEKRLDDLDYRKINETSIQTCRMDSMTGKKHEGIVIKEDFDSFWTDSVIAYNKIEEKYVPVFKAILGNIAMEKIVIRKETEGVTAGCGYAVIGRGYAGIFDIVVREDLRGKGYGREIVETLLWEAKKRGAEKSYLQVMLNNQAALHLYKKLGYREEYRYWYRKKQVK